jgi:hypothetical protein
VTKLLEKNSSERRGSCKRSLVCRTEASWDQSLGQASLDCRSSRSNLLAIGKWLQAAVVTVATLGNLTKIQAKAIIVIGRIAFLRARRHHLNNLVAQSEGRLAGGLGRAANHRLIGSEQD